MVYSVALLFYGLLRRRRLPGEASRRSSDTHTGGGSADHSVNKASSATFLARDSRATGVTILTTTAVAAVDRKIRRTRPSAVRRRRICDIHSPLHLAPTTCETSPGLRPKCRRRCWLGSTE